MNLNDNPTKEQLRELVRPFDHRSAHHVLWVDRSGEVRVTPMEKKTRRPPPPPPEVLDNALVYFEPFWSGNGYVGPDVSDEWVTDALDQLRREWAAATANGKPILIEI